MHGNMTHSIVRYIFKPLEEDSEEFQVPRITGTIEGSEIQHPPGTYEYGGTMEFHPPQLFINLHIVDTDRNINRPLNWNGRYQLSRCSTSSQ